MELNAHGERDSSFFSDLICKRLGRFDGAQASPLHPNPNAAQNAADASSCMQGGSSAVGSKPAPPVESSVPAARAVIGCEGLLDKVNRALLFRLATCVGSCGDPAGAVHRCTYYRDSRSLRHPIREQGRVFHPSVLNLRIYMLSTSTTTQPILTRERGIHDESERLSAELHATGTHSCGFVTE